VVDLPTSAVIIVHRSPTAPIHTHKTPNPTTTAIVQAIDGLGVVVPVLVFVLIPRAGRNIWREGRRRPHGRDLVTTYIYHTRHEFKMEKLREK
jgi:hypothetical protein